MIDMVEADVSARILAIEPDPESRALLHRALDQQVDTEVVVVPDIDAALRSIAQRVPDLILTSTFLAPADGARLMNDLRRRDEAMHTQVISTPHSLEAPETKPFDNHSSRVLRLAGRRSSVGAFQCDPMALRTQVEQYLERARALHAAAQDRREQGLIPVTRLVDGGGMLVPRRPVGASTMMMVPAPRDLRVLNRPQQRPVARAGECQTLSSPLRIPADRRRAARRRAADLAGQWAIKLNPYGDASLLDISCTGIRFETSTRLNAGSLIDLEVLGLDDSLAVAARLIRSEAVRTGGPEVIYRVAAMFQREIDLFTTNANPIMVAAAAAASHTPNVLADVLGRVLAKATWVSNGAALRTLLETEIEALVRAREVRIRALPIREPSGSQSVYFSIPSVTAPEHGLHVVFDRDYRPTGAELRLLKAAASLAAVVFDLAPIR